MNKIFKVVWSKTKECYVVVSEVAKNNGGKKKVLASVLAGLAMVGVAAQMGTPVQADSRYNKSTIVVAPNGLSPAYSSGTYKGSENNDVSYNSIVVGFLNNAYDPSTNGHFIFGANNKATNESTLALGNNNEATGPSSTAIGSGSEATGRNTIAMGNVAKANQIGNLAIGSYAKAQTSGTFMSTVTHAPEEKGYAVALGGYAEATEHSTVAVGAVSKASGFKATAVGAGAQAKGDNSTVVGTASVANSGDSFVGGFKNVTHGDRNVAVGTNNTVAGEDSIGVGSGVIATTGKTIAIGNTMVNPTYPNGRQTIARGKNKLDGSGNPMYGTTDVDNIFALAIGNGAQADGTAKSASGMIAIGQEVTADNNNTVAIVRLQLVIVLLQIS
ncbi:MAG: ESPR-type extended signal peptide-containing protein [Veillonella sp.]|uniref:ESPR-type extended signal peptide-containing protein n=1 Tax=Veillonella sp. TaxID=1926307 RepID=UPI002908616D|nr:ESPR-type extended signal peptide-containing protein [Veillonella sp.]MDU6788305.1 ESPR-type extended signal peptide-containing protein [Veillonella sp.]